MTKSKNAGIGFVDLDTSHPGYWTPIIRSLGYHIAGVFDSGTVYPAGHAQQFAAQHQIPRVFTRLDEMAASDEIDIAIVSSCNWDAHIARAEPFVRAGKAVLLGKPLAGNLRALNQLRAWVHADARLTGGSALRYCAEIDRFQASLVQHSPARTIIAGAGEDEVSYGIHAYALLCGLMGPGLAQVRHAGALVGGQHQVELRWRDGRQCLAFIGGGSYVPFYALAIHAQTTQYLPIGMDGLFQTFLSKTLAYLSGQTDAAPVAFETLIEAELALLAAKRSLSINGAWVHCSELTETQTGHDGAAFARRYRAEARKAA